MNVVSDFIYEDLEDLRQLIHHEKIFLTFSYYSGYIIASFNFFIFLLSLTLYIKVNNKILKSKVNFKRYGKKYYFTDDLEQNQTQNTKRHYNINMAHTSAVCGILCQSFSFFIFCKNISTPPRAAGHLPAPVAAVHR